MTRFPKVAEANRNRKWSPESKAKMRAALSGENNPFFGKTHSDETRKRLSDNWKPRRINKMRKYGISDEEYFRERDAGKRWCCGCKKPFIPANPRQSICLPCRRIYLDKYNERNREKIRERQKKYYVKTRDEQVKRSRDWYHALPEKERRDRGRRQSLKRKYGVTPEWYDAQLQKQNGGCAICGEHQPCGKYGEFMVVDHDHETGEPRGILCTGCNIGVGWIEKAEWLEKAHRYLQNNLSY